MSCTTTSTDHLNLPACSLPAIPSIFLPAPCQASKTESYNELRALMAQFMFKGDAIQKTVGTT